MTDHDITVDRAAASVPAIKPGASRVVRADARGQQASTRTAAPLPAHNCGMPDSHDSRSIPRKMKLTQRSPLLRNTSYLLAIDEHRNFTRAAEALSVSQSALSQKVRQLEDELGAQLFDRSGRMVQLTDFGSVYLKYVRSAHNNLLTAQRALHDVHDLSRGKLRIAFTPTFTEYLARSRRLQEQAWPPWPKIPAKGESRRGSNSSGNGQSCRSTMLLFVLWRRASAFSAARSLCTSRSMRGHSDSDIFIACGS